MTTTGGDQPPADNVHVQAGARQCARLRTLWRTGFLQYSQWCLLLAFEAVAQEGGQIDIPGIDIDRLELVRFDSGFNFR